jgi:hypothetical protein
MPFFWNGFCFGSLHRMNAAAAAAGKHMLLLPSMPALQIPSFSGQTRNTPRLFFAAPMLYHFFLGGCNCSIANWLQHTQ